MEGLPCPGELLFPFLKEEVTESEGGRNGHPAKKNLSSPSPESYWGNGTG